MSKQSSDDLDHDPTDELPVLLETVVLDDDGAPLLAAPTPDDTSEHTALFSVANDRERSRSSDLRADAAARGAKIEALEADIARLSSRWREVEQHLAEKDASLGDLDRTIGTLRQSLQERLATERRLTEQLTERDTRLREMAASHERLQREGESHNAELEQLRADLAAARQATATIEERLAHLPPPNADPAEIQALLEENAALAAYIDGRRAWWDDAQATHAGLAAKVAALEHELAGSAQRLKDAATFSTQESQRATALRAELIDYARRLDAAQRELRSARADSATTPAAEAAVKPAPTATVVLPATARRKSDRSIARAARNAASTSAPTNAEVARASAPTPGSEVVAQLEAEVGYKREQVAAQMIELRDREQRLRSLTAEGERVRQDLALTRTELENSRGDAARLERAILDKDRALQARDARVSTLQNELDQRLGALQKLSAMDVSIQGLDSRMSEQLRVAEPHADSARSPELICLTGDAPKRFALTKRTVTVGRSLHCDLQILTHFVSREHARISLLDNTTLIEDLGSRNGVFVNSVRVNRQKLQQGDLITIGETQFRFIESMAH